MQPRALCPHGCVAARGRASGTSQREPRELSCEPSEQGPVAETKDETH